MNCFANKIKWLIISFAFLALAPGVCLGLTGAVRYSDGAVADGAVLTIEGIGDDAITVVCDEFGRFVLDAPTPNEGVIVITVVEGPRQESASLPSFFFLGGSVMVVLQTDPAEAPEGVDGLHLPFGGPYTLDGFIYGNGNPLPGA